MISYKSSLIEISCSAIKNNLQFIKKIAGPKTKVSSVVKANAYGHGIEHYVPVAERFGIDHFSVFGSDEARYLKQFTKDDTTIMVMGWVNDEDIEWLLENRIEFYVFQAHTLNLAIEAAKRTGVKARIHLEVETGMNRTGVEEQELDWFIETIKINAKHLDLIGYCTHLAGAESIANYHRILKQIEKYEEIYTKIQHAGLKPVYRHVASSAATIAYPQARYDMVRIGIMQYGFWPSIETYIQYLENRKKRVDPLKRIISWRTKIMSIKNVKRGEFISYGTTFFSETDKKIAIIPVGYAYGYSRSLSNTGRVIVHGRRASVISMVNMNMLIIDVSKIPNVNPGDEVILIGKNGKNEISVSSFSELSDLLNYELLTRLPAVLERRIID